MDRFTISRAVTRGLRLATTCLIVMLLPAAPDLALAQDDTALAREVYADVNKRIGGMRTIETTAQRPDVSYKSEVKAWTEDGAVRKLQITDRDDSGDVITEYYYLKGNLVFVYQAVKGYAGNKQVTRVEHRQYFRDGKMFKWLGGMEKAAIAPQSREFAESSATLRRASATYVAAVEKAASGKEAGKSAPAEKTSTGVFLGIEQGDYAHFRLRTAGGAEETFMILRDTGGLAAFVKNPKAFVGKKVDLRWVERIENIPEAGGRTRVRVAVGAEVVK